MKIATSRDVEAPAERVFAELLELERYEEAIRAWGAEVVAHPRCGPEDARWNVAFDLARRWEIAAQVVDVVPPRRIAAEAMGEGIAARIDVDVAPLSPGRCRMTLNMAAKALTLRSRVMLQGLRLAEGRMLRQADARLAEIAAEAEGR